MKIQGKVVAKIQQEGGAQVARIQVYKKKKTDAAMMRIFDIVDDGELNIGDKVVIDVYRELIKPYEPPFEPHRIMPVPETPAEGRAEILPYSGSREA